MNLLTESEAVKLAEARVVLLAMRERTEGSYCGGVIAEACHQAEESIFRALNLAHTHGHSQVARIFKFADSADDIQHAILAGQELGGNALNEPLAVHIGAGTRAAEKAER